MSDQAGRHQIEKRAYQPDSTPDEVDALRARVFVHRPRIIMYREVPVQSTFQLELFDVRLGELAIELDNNFSLLIDLTEAGPPTAETRAFLKGMFGRHCRDKVAAVFTGRNFVLNVAAKFVLGSIFSAGNLKAYSIHRTREEAERAIESS